MGLYAIDSAYPLAKNNIFAGCGAMAIQSALFVSGTGYNATDQPSIGYPPTPSSDRVGQTFSFVDAAAGDYHLAPDDTGARDYGTSDVGAVTSTDIDGQTRLDPWDIGADESD